MTVSKHLRLAGIRIFTVLLSIPLLSGCSISSRVSEGTGEIPEPASPVLQDVYDRSVNKDVYSPGAGRGERLIQEPSLKPQDPLRDSSQ